MYIVLALVATVSLGVGVHFAVPRRGMRGAALAPAIAGATAAVVYAICTWTGLGEANPLTWLLSLVIPLLVAWIATDVISRARAARDAETAKRLGIA